jgi:insecticidal toxin complex protein TccC
MVTVIDNRGLSIRTLQYNRSVVDEAADERVTRQQYNAIGQLLSSLDPRLSSAQQSDPAVLANFRYQTSLSGQVLQNQSQDAGRHVTLFDVEGGPVWQENSRGFLKRLTYDALHRVSTVFEQDGAGVPERASERYVYGALPEQFDTFGRLMRHYDTAGLNEVLHYNYRGQPLQTGRQLLLEDAAQSDWQGDETQWPAQLESERYSSSVTYNALGEVLDTVDAYGNQQHRYLDVVGQLLRSGLTLAGESVERAVLASITYSAGGQVLREVASNGVVSTYTYEPQTWRLSRLTATRPALAGRSTLLQDLSYTYDPVGNILSISDAAIATSYANNQQIDPVNAYQYDALYLLCSASGRENAGASRQGPALPVAGSVDSNQYSNYTRQYQYDRGSNLIQMRHVGNSNYTLDLQVSSTSNRAVAQTGFLTPADVEGQFDAAGNLQQWVAGQPLSWDGRNQLQRVTQVQRSGADDDQEHYQYDGAGTRVRKTAVSQTRGTTRRAQVIYLPGLELRRTQVRQGTLTTTEEELHVLNLSSAGRQQVRLLHWVTGLPADMPNDQLRGSLDNQIGSSVLELDQNAAVLTQEEYYPFGGTAAWSGKNTSETTYKFVRYSGKERDATGLYYYGFRYYAPWLGRWINPDPGGVIDGPNLFAMVNNNPVTFRDDHGLAKTDEYEIENTVWRQMKFRVAILRAKIGVFKQEAGKFKNVNDFEVVEIGAHTDYLLGSEELRQSMSHYKQRYTQLASEVSESSEPGRAANLKLGAIVSASMLKSVNYQFFNTRRLDPTKPPDSGGDLRFFTVMNKADKLKLPGQRQIYGVAELSTLTERGKTDVKVVQMVVHPETQPSGQPKNQPLQQGTSATPLPLLRGVGTFLTLHAIRAVSKHTHIRKVRTQAVNPRSASIVRKF